MCQIGWIYLPKNFRRYWSPSILSLFKSTKIINWWNGNNKKLDKATNGWRNGGAELGISMEIEWHWWGEGFPELLIQKWYVAEIGMVVIWCSQKTLSHYEGHTVEVIRCLSKARKPWKHLRSISAYFLYKLAIFCVSNPSFCFTILFILSRLVTL